MFGQPSSSGGSGGNKTNESKPAASGTSLFGGAPGGGLFGNPSQKSEGQN